MLTVKPIEKEDISSLDDTGYKAMSTEERLQMVQESIQKSHDGKYFEFFKILVDDVIVGFMNLYAHTDHIISCGPEIKPSFRQLGYAYEAERLVLSMAKSKGYTVAVGDVREENTASRALHEKLGFEMERVCTNERGRRMCLYIKAL